MLGGQTQMKRIITLLLAFSMVIGTLVGCSGEKQEVTSAKATSSSLPTTSPKTDDKVDPNAKPTSIELGNIRIQLLSDRLVRIEMKGPKGFEDRPSYNIVKRLGWREVGYTISEKDGMSVITTEKYVVYLSPDAKNEPNGAYITDTDGKVLWTYLGETDTNIYLPSPSDELTSWYFTDSPRVIPSENGYTPSESGEKNNGWDKDNDAVDAFIFLPGGSYENFALDFITLTGPSEMVTLQMLGYWDSRWYEYTAETALRQIKDYRDRGYSIDMLVIDTDWRQSSSIGGVGYTINKKLFPNMADFLEKAHDLGVSIMFNDHPEPKKDTDSLIDNDEVEYRNKNLKLILSLGLDIWWYDRNWGVALNEIKDGMSIYASGMYAYQWITEDYYNSITDIDEFARRALIMGNVDGILHGEVQYAPEISSHKYSIQWTGDIGATVDDLNDEVYNAIFGGSVLGLPYISADIGGHVTDVSDDMYVRWMQFGALSPIMRVHCTKPYSRMPWLFGDTAEAVTHTYVDLRYRLLPLYYALSHENYVSGLPLTRRLDILYPDLVEASRNDEYLLGDYLLVAPVTESFATTDDYKFTSGGKDGLYAEYFSNKDLSGEPSYTGYDEHVYFDWQGSGPDCLGLSDRFSIRWSGEVTVGKNDMALRFFADDGIRIWIDGERVDENGWAVYDVEFISKTLKAGTTHSITIEYFEDGYYAHIYVEGITDQGVSREVFIPEGEWMDVWNGKTYAGPATITVSHTLETSPIFVRMGSIFALADNMVSTSEKDWSHMTLDVYPGITNSASTVIYEDDTKTVAYKKGHYRTTKLTLSPIDQKSISLKIDAAKGIFEGDLAFTKRSYTLRVHSRDGFGALESVTIDGKSVKFEKIARDANGAPLAALGGSPDADVYTLKFDTDVNVGAEIVLTFASTSKDKVNESYNRISANFTAELKGLDKETASVDLTGVGGLDWILFTSGNMTEAIRKKTDSHLLDSLTSHQKFTTFYDNYQIGYRDGDKRLIGTTSSGAVSKVDFSTVIKVPSGNAYYKLYIGGYKSLSKITVRDRAGNVQTFNLGNMKGNYYNVLTIDCSAAANTELYVTYSILCGDNITFSAIAASDKKAADTIAPSTGATNSALTVDTPYTGTLDLSAEGTVDWEFYGKVNGSQSGETVRKAGVTDRINTTFDTTSQLHDDNKGVIKWSDGDIIKSAETRHGKNDFDSITVRVDIKDCKKLTLFVGAWNASGTIVIYDADGNQIDGIPAASAAGDARIAIVTADLTKYDTDSITVCYIATNKTGGNISLSGVALS